MFLNMWAMKPKEIWLCRVRLFYTCQGKTQLAKWQCPTLPICLWAGIYWCHSAGFFLFPSTLSAWPHPPLSDPTSSKFKFRAWGPPIPQSLFSLWFCPSAAPSPQPPTPPPLTPPSTGRPHSILPAPNITCWRCDWCNWIHVVHVHVTRNTENGAQFLSLCF